MAPLDARNRASALDAHQAAQGFDQQFTKGGRQEMPTRKPPKSSHRGYLPKAAGEEEMSPEFARDC